MISDHTQDSKRSNWTLEVTLRKEPPSDLPETAEIYTYIADIQAKSARRLREDCERFVAEAKVRYLPALKKTDAR